MTLIAICLVIAGVLVFGWSRMKRAKERREFERHSIEPEALKVLLESKADVTVLDVRQPLDLLAYPEIIPGAVRISPAEILADPSRIPRERDTIVYCTCPSDETSRSVLRKAKAWQFYRVKFLRGGLAGWKAKGFEVEPYDKPFHLDE
jgi:rhodanese-related sulfurtransferase